MSAEERELAIEYFDLVKFDNRVKTIAREMIQPLALDATQILKEISRMKDHALKMELRINDSRDTLERSIEALKDFRSVDHEVRMLQRKFKDHQSESA